MSRKTLLFGFAILFVMTVISGCATRTAELTTDGYGVKGDKWIMPRSEDDMPVWGIKNGILIGIHPARMSWGKIFGGPRGLFRIGYENDDVLRFINFMVVNPMSRKKGRLDPNGSELLRSPTDGRKGIMFYAYPLDYLQHPDRYKKIPSHHLAAEVRKRNGREVLTWGVKTERFPNGAECFFVFRIDEKRYNEVEIECHLIRGGNTVLSLVLSSTFGNITRLRNAYLKGGTVNAKKLYTGDYGNGFAPMEFWEENRFQKDINGDLLFIAGPDEERPWEIDPYPHPTKFLQYYRKKRDTWDPEIRAMVNARAKFWKSSQKIPGGVSYENLAIIENFEQGQRLIYGIYRGSVNDLLKGRPSKR